MLSETWIKEFWQPFESHYRDVLLKSE